MRRFLAITAMAALILSTGLPVWASTCHVMDRGKTPVCHRTAAHQHHHCETMAEQQEQAAADPEFMVKSSPEKCPMRCCTQAQSGHGPAVLLVSFVPELPVCDLRSDVPTIIFAHNGFSSHTDRGPPSLS